MYKRQLVDGTALQGFYCFGPGARVPGYAYDGRFLDMGLGMRPDLVRKGLGLEFVRLGMAAARERFGERPLRLSVAAFNRGAMAVYGRAGFCLLYTSKTLPLFFSARMISTASSVVTHMGFSRSTFTPFSSA